MTTPSAAAIAAANPFGIGLQGIPEVEDDSPPPEPSHEPVATRPARIAIAWALGVRGSILFKVGKQVYTIDASTVAAAMNTKEPA